MTLKSKFKMTRDNNQTQSESKKKDSWARRALNASSNSLLGLDQFAEGFHMRLDTDGRETVNTTIGACCSFILLFIVMAYAYQKGDVWLSKKGNIIIMSTQQGAVPYDQQFTY